MLVLIVITYLSLGHELHLFVMFQLIIVAQLLSAAIDMIPVHALFGTEFLIAVERIDEFLAAENKPKMKLFSKKKRKQIIAKSVDIKISDGSFQWMSNHTLSDINIEVKRGKLIAIVGKVGSGKSSLLQAILGEMQMTNGKYFINNDKKMIAYVAQTAFILNGTLRDNILLGLEFNAEKYDRILDVSALKPDIRILPKNDSLENVNLYPSSILYLCVVK